MTHFDDIARRFAPDLLFAMLFALVVICCLVAGFVRLLLGVPPAPPGPPPQLTCVNCGEDYAGEHCPMCGARA